MKSDTPISRSRDSHVLVQKTAASLPESGSSLISGLKDQSYIRIWDGKLSSYGGSQMWFHTKGQKGGSRRIKGYGCGLIAFGDLLFYLAAHHETRRPDCMQKLFDSEDGPDKAVYMEYIYYLDRTYLRVIPQFGLPGFAVAIAMNIFFFREKLPYRASWKWTLSSRKMLEKMKEMLAEDIPVIFSVGPNTPFFWIKKGIPFYSRDPSGAYKLYEKICGHYITLTGICLDPSSGKTMLQISSWGKELYIDYAEYRAYVRTKGDVFTSSMVYIRHV